MAGKISFCFDYGFTLLDDAFELFKEYGCTAAVAISAGEGFDAENARKLQDAGWEIMCNPLICADGGIEGEAAEKEIEQSKKQLADAGLNVSVFITKEPCDAAVLTIIKRHCGAVFTQCENAAKLPVERLVITKPVNPYALRSADITYSTVESLKSYVDYIAENGEWLALYCHDAEKATLERLRTALEYCCEKNVEAVTITGALKAEKCRTQIIEEGWDGEKCYVHIRPASDGKGRILLTGQKLDVRGCDYFDILRTNYSSDGGKTRTGFIPNESFSVLYTETERRAYCDMTPMYHKKTGKFIVTGHTAQYEKDSYRLVDALHYNRTVPYAVFDEKTGRFGEVRNIEMPDKNKYRNCGSGCSQCEETENGDLLIPLAYSEIKDGVAQNSKVSVMRASFDGETIKCIEIGNELEVKDEVRGIGEASIIFCNGVYYLTSRGDTYGYFSYSKDGINFTQPDIWHFDNGEILPTYNTQSHWMLCGKKLYLVYTRRNGHNGHVFRHRAPLYAARVDTEAMTILRETEFVCVPERGARLGNFGVCRNGDNAIITVSEWMQPEGCEKYGSNNAVWFCDVTLGE